MKRLTLFFLFSFSLCHALPLTNIADPAIYECGCFGATMDYGLNIRMGYWGDFVFNRNIKVQASSDAFEQIPVMSISTNAGMLLVNFREWIEVYGTFGQTDFQYEFSKPLGSVTFFPAEAWSVGLRTAYRWNQWIVGAEGQYFQSKPSVDRIFNFQNNAMHYYEKSRHGRYRELQGGFGLAYQIESYGHVNLIPYMGIKFAGVRQRFLANFDTDSSSPGLKYKARTVKSVGYAVGATAMLGHAIGLTAEGRFGDEKALYVNGQFRF